METHRGMQDSWTPETPVKPNVARQKTIYDDGQGGILAKAWGESEAYLSKYRSQNNEGQTFLPYSISDNNWDGSQGGGNPSLMGNIGLLGENGETQRRDFEGNNPHWSSQGRRSVAIHGSDDMASVSHPMYNACDLMSSWTNHGVRGNGMLEHNLSDYDLNTMKFGDLLNINELLTFGNNGGTTFNGGMFLPGSVSQSEESRSNNIPVSNNQEGLHGTDQRINGWYGQGVRKDSFPGLAWSVRDPNSFPSNDHANKSSAFAPATPDFCQRLQSNVVAGDTPYDIHQGLYEQISLQEHEVSAATVKVHNQQSKNVSEPITDSPSCKDSVVVEEQNPEKGVSEAIDLNDTSQKKPRRRRYQPKVIRENKPRPTPKPKTPKPTETQDNKRKYVRKNKTNPPIIPSGEETEPKSSEMEPKSTETVVKSCKKSLNFDLNGGLDGEPQASEYRDTENQSSGPANLSGVEEIMVKTSMTAYDLNFTVNQELKEYISLPEKENVPGEKAESSTRKDSCKEQSPSSSPCASSSEGRETRGSKRSLSFIEEGTLVDVEIGTIPQSTPWKPNYLSSEITHSEIPSQSSIPEVGKRKKTKNISQVGKDHSHRQVELTTSKYYCHSTTVELNVMNNNHATLEGGPKNMDQLMTTWADLSRLKHKSSTKGITHVQDLEEFPGKKYVNGSYPCQAIFNGVRPCTEEPPADINATPKPKRRSKKQDSVNKNWEIVPYNNILLARETDSVRAIQWKKRRMSIEKLAELFQQLDINREKHRKSRKRPSRAMVCYQGNKQEQNALVLYNKDGSMVTYKGPFNPGSKRRPRAKVDLDDETTRVWRLLLENIDNEGINGTDEQKAKWWENERRVFRGRVDSFIARMRLVQGDRRFTPWKGSVLDSVIGVFLTQNVSDHLSSSAFMSMAARFPLKTENSGSTLSEEAISGLFVEPEICIIEHEESITWNEKMVDQQSLDKKSRAIFYFEHTEEKEVVNSSEASQRAICLRGYNANSHTTETDTVNNDATSSPQSIISSQNSINSPNQQTSGITITFSDSSSKFNCPDHSFMGLLKMAESNIQHQSNSQSLLPNHLEGKKHVPECYHEQPGISPSHYQLNLKAGFCFRDVQGIDILEVESRSSDMSRKDENSPTTEQSNLTSEITDQERSPDSFPGAAHNTSSCFVLDGETMVVQSQMQKVQKQPLDTVPSAPTCKGINVPLSKKMADNIESTGEQERTSNSEEVKQTQEHHYASGSGMVFDVNTNHNKTETGTAEKETKNESDWDSLRRDRTAGKGKKNAFDWDSLRRDAQINGKKPERPAHTRDSLDWEAVLHADASDIAETIKERGMNNVLAGRIKDLLNRLVKDHGSIDMEWLRDIPPDKAKEYLLSFRGLGLKSVECVRLLTLHHLAFPVDTNVGRIAVRLGWVPLQPLPESLQLHLLEMYPILESIQQYLWPRLCKLDQKTLYELHYHMITFGKVFCTKRQPNCNACPLRGECRHFASAFASARFSLPEPEDKSIVPASGNTAPNVNLNASTNFLPSTSSWIGRNPQSNTEGYCEAIVHGRSFPLPLPSPLDVHLERKSINSICEPIVEVPASPEQEPQHEQALCDIEDTFYDDPNEIPTINLNMKQFSDTLQNFMLQGTEMSKALVALTAEAASIPTPKLKNINRLRTEHHVYELPDTHPLLHEFEKREPDDPCSYLLAIWTPGETADSIDPPARRCCFDNPNMLCNEETCSYCSSQRETDSQIVRGTLLIPTRTAMRGSFPLNGTYFQVNEVFADHDSSLNPIAVPRNWLWNLARRTVYFGTSIPTIFKGLGTEDIQHCFWRGYVCVRGFDQKTRAPRPLMARLHFPASRLVRGAKGKAYDV